jgi:hypothetical protein
MGVASDPDGRQASAAMAWRKPDGSIALTMLVHGKGAHPDAFGTMLRDLAAQRRILTTAYDALTDADSARYLLKPRKVGGQEFRNASAKFVQLVEAGRLHHHDAAAVTAELAYTTRKEHDESGSFAAVRANDDVPITAVLAAIRAVWLAAEPPQGTPRVG